MANARIERALHLDGKRRYLVTVTDGDDSIKDRVIVPDDVTDDRAHLVDRARELFAVIKNRQRMAVENVQEEANWASLIDDPPVDDVDLRKSRRSR